MEQREDVTLLNLQQQVEYLEQTCAALQAEVARLRRFEQVIEHMADPVLMTDTNQQIAYMNAAALRMHHVGSLDDLPRRDAASVLVPEEQHRLANEIWPQVVRDGCWVGRLQIQTLGGTPTTVEERAWLLTDGHGLPVGMSLIGHDLHADASVEHELTHLVGEMARQAEQLQIFKTLADSALDGICLLDTEGIITYANAALGALTGLGRRVVGSHISLLYGEHSDTRLQAEIADAVLTQGRWQGLLQLYRPDGTHWMAQINAALLTDHRGKKLAQAAIVRDMTAHLQMEQERATLQQQMIDSQRDAIRELSAPLIPLSEGVMVLPLVGAIDDARAQQVMHSLLEGIAAHRTQVVILDVTGVRVMDTQVADMLVSAARAARLLGARVLLTGIGPAVAHMLVHLGADLGDMMTCSTLQAGVARALGHEHHAAWPVSAAQRGSSPRTG